MLGQRPRWNTALNFIRDRTEHDGEIVAVFLQLNEPVLRQSAEMFFDRPRAQVQILTDDRTAESVVAFAQPVDEKNIHRQTVTLWFEAEHLDGQGEVRRGSRLYEQVVFHLPPPVFRSTQAMNLSLGTTIRFPIRSDGKSFSWSNSYPLDGDTPSTFATVCALRNSGRSSAECSVGYYYHPVATEHSIAYVERFTFPSLRDFLCVELGKAIFSGNAPRQCRLCGKWFLHEQGDRSVYCERIAPGETERTCREKGARTVFEKKLQDEDAWKLYKRAYKKYYARLMKGNMSREEFKIWADQAAANRDATIERLKCVSHPLVRLDILDDLKKQLNEL